MLRDEPGVLGGTERLVIRDDEVERGGACFSELSEALSDLDGPALWDVAIEAIEGHCVEGLHGRGDSRPSGGRVGAEAAPDVHLVTCGRVWAASRAAMSAIWSMAEASRRGETQMASQPSP